MSDNTTLIDNIPADNATDNTETDLAAISTTNVDELAKKIIIHNPNYGTKHCGPLDNNDIIEIKDLIRKVKAIKREKPHFFNNRTIIQGIRDGNSEDQTYKIGFYNFAISKGRMELQHIVKRFPPETDLEKVVDKWGDILGYLFWRGKICDFEFSFWTD